jgi:small-conductance mechanosensitive channel
MTDADSLSGIVSDTLDQFVANLTAALPRLLSGLVFLVVAAVVVKTIMFVVKLFLSRALPGEAPALRQFAATVVAVFLWFGVALGFLSTVGLGAIAAALGTASGFLALGVSYALSNMIADAVAGVYLLRDPDFNPGDSISAGDTTGIVRTIELRKTRIEVGNDVIVRANADIEKRWTKHDDATPE